MERGTVSDAAAQETVEEDRLVIDQQKRRIATMIRLSTFSWANCRIVVAARMKTRFTDRLDHYSAKKDATRSRRSSGSVTVWTVAGMDFRKVAP